MHYNIYILIYCEFNSRAMRFFFPSHEEGGKAAFEITVRVY